MSHQLTLAVPDALMRRAERAARSAGRTLNEVINDALERSLTPLGMTDERPVSELPDAELMQVAAMKLPVEFDRRLSQLLKAQSDRRLQAGEAEELAAMMQVYDEGDLRKTRAMIEAVARGLMESPVP